MLRRLALLLSLGLGACASVRGLDAAPVALAPDERSRIEGKVSEALLDEEWTAAWNQAVDLGGDRTRMEDIFLRALKADSGPVEDMLAKIREKWGGLSPEAMAEARTLAGTIEKEGRQFERVMEIELLVADDAPHYRRAWEVYGRAPPDDAPDLLAMILEARAEAEESRD